MTDVTVEKVMDVTVEEVFPFVPSYNYMFMLEAMTYKVTLSIPDGSCGSFGPEQLTVQAWTNQYDSDHNDGNWHSIDLDHLQSSADERRHSYGKSVIITSDKDFRFTFRYRRTGNNRDWHWTHPYMVDGIVHVEPPRLYDSWTLGPDYTHIEDCVYLGNFIAATNATQCGFTHVLNVADNLDMVYTAEENVTYKKIPMRDGAHNPIETEKVAEAVTWLLDNNNSDNRILVNCRAGIGRAGSVAVAFVFARNPYISYYEAKDFVLQKRFIYPHAGLQEILYNLFERK